MQLSPELVSSLLQEIYAAAAEPDRWTSVLGCIVRTVGASRSYLLMTGPVRHYTIAAEIGMDPTLVQLYAEHYAHRDPIMDAIAAVQGAAGGDWIGDRTALMPDRQYLALDSVNDIILPQGDLHLCGTALDLGGGSQASFALRRLRTDKPFEPEVIALVNILAPHLKQAFRLHAALHAERTRAETMASSVEAFGTAVLSVDERGRICQMSSAAAALLGQGSGLRLVNGALCAVRQEDDDRLRELIQGAAATGRGAEDGPAMARSMPHGSAASRVGAASPAAGGVLTIQRLASRSPLQVLVTPFSSDAVLPLDRPAALIFLHEGDGRLPSRGAVLRSLYNLSPSHARLADLLLAGMTLREAADEIGVSEDTARFHLKSIFRLAGVPNQGALLRLMMTLPGIDMQL